MALTYEPIQTTTLTSAQGIVTFSSIPSTYTDLVVIITGLQSTSSVLDFGIRFNSDSGSNYSDTNIEGNGSTATSGRNSNHTQGKLAYFGSTTWVGTLRVNIMNYTNTTTNKTVISRYDIPANQLGAAVNLWRSTAAINSVSFLMTSGNIASGSTFTLYGIKQFT